jgi:prepilin peptidase CpaA
MQSLPAGPGRRAFFSLMGTTMNQALQLLLLWLVLQAAVTDLALRRIPNVLVLCGLALSLLLYAISGPPGELLSTWLAGLAAGFFLFLPLYVLRGMAAGDVKLMAMTGAFVGPALALQIALLSCLVGGLIGLAMLLMSGRWPILCNNLKPFLYRLAGYPVEPIPITRETSAGGIPYGLAIAIGTAAVVFKTHGITFA